MSSIMSDENADMLGKMLNEGKPMKYCLQCGKQVDHFYMHDIVSTVDDGVYSIGFKPRVSDCQSGVCEECSLPSSRLAFRDIVLGFEHRMRDRETRKYEGE